MVLFKQLDVEELGGGRRGKGSGIANEDNASNYDVVIGSARYVCTVVV